MNGSLLQKLSAVFILYGGIKGVILQINYSLRKTTDETSFELNGSLLLQDRTQVILHVIAGRTRLLQVRKKGHHQMTGIFERARQKRGSVADPDPGSGALLTPGSRIRDG